MPCPTDRNWGVVAGLAFVTDLRSVQVPAPANRGREHFYRSHDIQRENSR
jgi:hypothetical protein